MFKEVTASHVAIFQGKKANQGTITASVPRHPTKIVLLSELFLDAFIVSSVDPKINQFLATNVIAFNWLAKNHTQLGFI